MVEKWAAKVRIIWQTIPISENNVTFAANLFSKRMTTITLRYDESNQTVIDTIGNLISSGLASVDETIPDGSMTVSQFSTLLKNGIRKHYLCA